MKKLMMIGLMVIAPLIATPSHSITPETIKLALAGTGWVGSLGYALQAEPGVHNLPILVPLLGSGIVLENLFKQSNSLLTKGLAKVLMGFPTLALCTKALMESDDYRGFDKTGLFLWRALYTAGAFGYAILAADGTKDIIEGIAEKFESNPKQIEQPVNQIVQSSHYTPSPLDQARFIAAIDTGDLVTVKQYITAGIDVNQLVELEWQGTFLPIEEAAMHKHYIIVEALLDAGADVNARNRNNCIPLHFAATNGSTDIARILLEHGANVNASGNDNYTPLHAASTQGNVEMVKFLISNGADATMYYGDPDNNYGQAYTAYDLAIQYGHREIAQILAEHEKNITNKETQ